LAVFSLYRMRRVGCRRCGVTVGLVPWARGKGQQTEAFAWFLTFWAKLPPWQPVAQVFRVSWATAFGAVGQAVEWGLARRQLRGVEALGVDEVQWQRGHRYVTLVYHIEGGCKRLLYVGLERTAERQHGRGAASLVRADEQPVLAAERGALHLALGHVVVDRQEARFGIADQGSPVIESVADRFGHRTLGQHLRLLFQEPVVELIQDRHAAGKLPDRPHQPGQSSMLAPWPTATPILPGG
jgi:hypothetical protein